MLSIVTTFRDLRDGATFQFNGDGCTYRKVNATTYQLLDHDGRPVPAMTYALGWRSGQDDPVLLPSRSQAA